MKTLFGLGIAAIGVASLGCTNSTGEDVGAVASAVTFDCTQRGLSPELVRDCINGLRDMTPAHAYCPAGSSSPYVCSDFSKAYCETAVANGVSCAEIGVMCTQGTSNTANGGHAVSVVFMNGACYAVEPQSNGDGVLAGPWPPSNELGGTCNTYPASVADAICHEGGFTGHAKCISFYHGSYPGYADDDTGQTCFDLERPATIAD